VLGRRIYDEKPSRFTARFEAWWRRRVKAS
jgi:hypothetical protein